MRLLKSRKASDVLGKPLATSDSPQKNVPSISHKVDASIHYAHAQSTDILASDPSGKYLVPENADYGRQVFGADENVERGNWTGKLDFLLSCLGYAVGLGNVWRFPYLCYRNGGGAFFIPYIIMLVFVGVPLFFLELSLGQFVSSGPLTCWKMAPIFKDCSRLLPDVECNWLNQTQNDNGTCFEAGRFVGLWNYSMFYNITGRKRLLPSEEYYNEGVHIAGPAHWDLSLCLLLAWIIVFFCMIKGIKSSGKVVYFTALFPYTVLVILFFRGVTLKGAAKGVLFYIVPRWHRLLDARIWYDAAVQIFFSLSLGGGGLIALSSYNRFHNTVLRDTLIVSIGNCMTSIFAGFVIFSFLGYMADELNTTVDKVVNDGPGLAFVVYPYAILSLPGSPFWAILFFCMLLTLGLDSQFAMIETILTSILDQYKSLRSKKTYIVLGLCIVLFLLGLNLCTSGGAYWLQLLDTYSGGWGILIIGLLECSVIGWLYGSDRFYKDIQLMIGRRPIVWWRICWQGFSPLLILAIIIFGWTAYTPASFGESYRYPIWADAMGWSMSFCSVIWIPIYAIYRLCHEEGGCCTRLRYLTLPTPEWGPALVKHRRLVDYVVGFVVDPWQTGASKLHTPSGELNPALDLHTDSSLSRSQNSLSRSVGSLGRPVVSQSPGLSQSAVSVVTFTSEKSAGAVSNVSYESGV